MCRSGRGRRGPCHSCRGSLNRRRADRSVAVVMSASQIQQRGHARLRLEVHRSAAPAVAAVRAAFGHELLTAEADGAIAAFATAYLDVDLIDKQSLGSACACHRGRVQHRFGGVSNSAGGKSRDQGIKRSRDREPGAMPKRGSAGMPACGNSRPSLTKTPLRPRLGHISPSLPRRRASAS